MSRREGMPAHERFKQSYFGNSRHGERPPSVAPPAPRPRPERTPDVCAGCGYLRAKRERGWWNARTFYHYHCVPSAILADYASKFGTTLFGRELLNRVSFAKAVRGVL